MGCKVECNDYIRGKIGQLVEEVKKIVVNIEKQLILVILMGRKLKYKGNIQGKICIY